MSFKLCPPETATLTSETALPWHADIMEEQSPAQEDPHVMRRRARWAMVIGAIIGAIGFLLTLMPWVIYVGEWPDQRPFYPSGIGYIMLFMGIISLLAGAFLHMYYSIDIEAANKH